jgi:pimeloyl-ACP methyl ester carboxylesterase
VRPNCSLSQPRCLTNDKTPSRYVVCTGDGTLNPQWMREAAEQFCDEVVEFDSGHSPFWSKPDEFCQLLNADDQSGTTRPR